MTTGIFRCIALADRADEGRVVERREGDAGDSPRDRVLDFGDLRVALVLAQRSAPGDRHSNFLCRLFRASMDALPEDMRRPLGDHGDGDAAALLILISRAGGTPQCRDDGQCCFESHRCLERYPNSKVRAVHRHSSSLFSALGALRHALLARRLRASLGPQALSPAPHSPVPQL